jgi:hypothetical protein
VLCVCVCVCVCVFQDVNGQRILCVLLHAQACVCMRASEARERESEAGSSTKKRLEDAHERNRGIKRGIETDTVLKDDKHAHCQGNDTGHGVGG